MSYSIDTRSITEFVTDSDIKLPRFQRKSTWTAKQNFELAISIFQEYPVGVVIINDEKGTLWLLDGRQRRNALNQLRANPDLVYEWARKYIKFKTTESDDRVKTLFWNTVDSYLQTEKEDDSAETSDDDANDTDVDISKERVKEGLNTLLEIILMVHQQKNGVGKWERIFDLTEYITSLNFALKSDGYKVNPIALRSYLLDYHNSTKKIDLENFIQYLDNHGGIKEEKNQDLKKRITQNWAEMQHIIEVIGNSERIIKAARIGVILIKNVTPLDAQNIFSRINSGGTQLKAEELLSAKPFWNERVVNNDSKMLDLVKDLYNRLGVETPQDGNVVRWDYGATLISRIKDRNILFDINLNEKKENEVDMNQITLGFKLISSYFRDGMSAVVVNEIEKDGNIKWGQSIDELVQSINKICEILHGCDFFRYFSSWRKSIYHLMGSAIVLEFITILVKDWESKDCPTVAGSQLNNFIRDAKCLFDRLVYEYATGQWKGSGDSKMAKHLKNWQDRIKPLDGNNWIDFITSSSNGEFHGQPLDIKHLTPILCYQYALQRKRPEDTLEETSEVDHVIPQAKLSGHFEKYSKYKDALFNLVLLPKSDNNQKKDKYLNELPTQSLKDSYASYSCIKLSSFDTYSDVANIEQLKDERIDVIKHLFEGKRTSELAN